MLAASIVSLVIFFHTVSKSVAEIAQTPDNQAEKQLILTDLGNGWYEATGSAGIRTLSAEQAKEKAIEAACLEALQKHCGIRVNSSTEITRLNTKDAQSGIDDFYHMTRQTSNGVVLEYQCIKEWIDPVHAEQYVRVKVLVGKQAGEQDWGFNLEVKANKKHFKHNDPMELTVNSSKDCYLTIFNIVKDDVYVLYPNAMMKSTQVHANTPFCLPGEYKKAGIFFPAMVAEGKDSEAGLIKVIATKDQPFPINGFDTKTRYNTNACIKKELIKKMVGIPRSQMAETDVDYTITRE